MSDSYNNYEQESIFDREPQALVPVSVGVRFANFIVDIIVAYAIIIGLSIMLSLLSPGFASYVLENSDDFGFKIMDRVISGIALALVFTLSEGLSKGRTLGKLITGTVAVREDGAPFTWTEAFKRSFSRIVPFEPFSALGGHPWHDKWSKTMVVKKF